MVRTIAQHLHIGQACAKPQVKSKITIKEKTKMHPGWVVHTYIPALGQLKQGDREFPA